MQHKKKTQHNVSTVIVIDGEHGNRRERGDICRNVDKGKAKVGSRKSNMSTLTDQRYRSDFGGGGEKPLTCDDPSVTKVVDMGTWGTRVDVAAAPEQASTTGEGEEVVVGVRAFQASHRTRSSSVHVLRHRSLQGAAAYAVDTQGSPTVIASSLGLAGTSFRGVLGVEGPCLRGP